MFNLANSVFLQLTFSIIGGVLLAVFAFSAIFSAVPIAFITLSYGLSQGIFVAVVTTVILMGFMHPLIALIFLCGFFMPILVLSCLALLSRQTQSGDYVLYPAGRLLFVVILFATCSCMSVYAGSVVEDGALVGVVAELLAEVLEDAPNLRQLYEASGLTLDVERTALLMVLTGMACWPLILLGNVFAGQSLAKFLQQNLRETPKLNDLQLPSFLAYVFLFCLAAGLWQSSQTDASWVGDFLLSLAAICAMGYFLLGLSIIHVISRGWSGRTFILSALYFLVVMVSWLMIPVILIGLFDRLADFRGLSKKPPADKTKED